MLNVVTLNGPSIELTVDGSGALAVKRDLLLDNWAIAYESLPADLEILRSYIWSQQMADYPAGCYGDVTWAVYSKLYGDLSGVPAQERCQPVGLDLLGRLLFRPGADQLDWRDHPEPILYQAGQKIGAFFEVASAPSRAFSLFPAVRVRSTTGFVPLPGIVYHNLLNASTPTSTPAYSYRSRFSSIPQGGTEVRVTVQTLWDGGAATHVSIGVQSGATWNMAATPVQFSFDGSPGFSQAGIKTLRSAWAPLVTTAGCSLLVHSCIPAGPHGYKCAFDDSCYVAGLSGHDTAAFSGTPQSKLTHTVAMIEVR